MSPKTAKFILTGILGWKYDEGVVPEPKAVILGVPHTSIWDFVLGYLYYRAVGGHMRTMIKKEAFFWPLGGWLRKLGAFPMDRQHPQGPLASLIEEMKSAERFTLVICPEGTRKAVHKWKTGYHTIATAVGCPVYLGHFDYKSKTLGRGQAFPLTADARADTDRIQAAYEQMDLTALHPKGYTTK